MIDSQRSLVERSTERVDTEVDASFFPDYPAHEQALASSPMIGAHQQRTDSTGLEMQQCVRVVFSHPFRVRTQRGALDVDNRSHQKPGQVTQVTAKFHEKTAEPICFPASTFMAGYAKAPFQIQMVTPTNPAQSPTHRVDDRMKPQLMSGHERDSRGCHGFFNGVKLFGGQGHGFLAEYVFAGSGSGKNLFMMRFLRTANGHSINPGIRDQRCHVVKYRSVVLSRHGFRFHARGIAETSQFAPAVPTVTGRVNASHGAATDDSHAKRASPCSPRVVPCHRLCSFTRDRLGSQ